MTGKAKSGKHNSFHTFFKANLLPPLEKFERTRRRRLPFLIVLTGVLGMVCGVSFVFLLILGLRLWDFWWLLVFVGAAIMLFLSAGAALCVLKPEWKSRRMAELNILLITHVFPVWFQEFAQGMLEAFDHIVFDNRTRRYTFSHMVIKPLIDFAAPGLEWKQADFIKQGDFIESLLYGSAYTRYWGHDLFSGKRPDYDISFSWLSVYNVIMRQGEKRRRENLFTGWFFMAEFPREFSGRTVVLPDVAEAFLGWAGRSLQEMMVPPGMELLLFEDPTFEHYFKVHSSGQLEARYILTPRFMGMLGDTAKRLKRPIALSFRLNRMYVAFPDVMEYFTLFPVHSFTDPMFCRQLFHAAKAVEQLARDVANNQMLWRDSFEFDYLNPGELAGGLRIK